MVPDLSLLIVNSFSLTTSFIPKATTTTYPRIVAAYDHKTVFKSLECFERKILRRLMSNYPVLLPAEVRNRPRA